ncbi:hypothetical protein PUNSTDRAFT_143272 [Punctularia strigosozonata HHB-11173 SS5]|uniref:uncharacterized protein n=1 Tax=Punctularia strigosozonata (strain HHB-11173) TaxID=741275 RepID=UPI00044184BA|nr:uncharacterized protein PUNSTDRAFT_143272 [Punctularia strigosozonata HHB-11173 SS5]EIN09858.1 hypothetical protein PUNSTDRAFT_143272 [Punctularia strigosozonata HHB-11173 SS5]
MNPLSGAFAESHAPASLSSHSRLSGANSIPMTLSTATFPKYWNAQRDEVAYGLELTPEHVPVVHLLGTYTWLYLHDSHYGARLVSPGPSSASSATDGAGHLTLSLAPSSAHAGLSIDGDVEPRLSGSFSLGHLGLRGTFSPGDVRRARSSTGEPIPSRWSVRIRWHDDDDDDDDDAREARHFFDVCAARDDAGRPFVQFVWDGGMNMGRAYRIALLGKRLPQARSSDQPSPPPPPLPSFAAPSLAPVPRRVTGKLARREAEGVELSAGERQRLGMGLDEAQVVKAGRARVGAVVLLDSSNAQAGTKRKLRES